MDELLSKFPEMVKALLQKVSQTENKTENPVRKAARDKLIARLQVYTDELARLSKQPGEKLTEEQMKEILAIPRPQSQMLPWMFLPAPAPNKGGNK